MNIFNFSPPKKWWRINFSMLLSHDNGIVEKPDAALTTQHHGRMKSCYFSLRPFNCCQCESLSAECIPSSEIGLIFSIRGKKSLLSDSLLLTHNKQEWAFRALPEWNNEVRDYLHSHENYMGSCTADWLWSPEKNILQ